MLSVGMYKKRKMKRKVMLMLGMAMALNIGSAGVYGEALELFEETGMEEEIFEEEAEEEVTDWIPEEEETEEDAPGTQEEYTSEWQIVQTEDVFFFGRRITDFWAWYGPHLRGWGNRWICAV